ncbi:DNA-binding protein [Mergibacter septicus]|uniref:helix-turn-helix domain-containing protein n=1 Tax=Mergibacter septicus TaxID=221402 RepID=UPI001178DE0F|nr:helix-turn-helix domain-containing protein [Mergibacter septicus]AWX14240.1 DNA-binding protein [Mergibacter septicus]
MKKDWDKIDIIYHLNKRGLSLSELSRRNNLNPRTLNNALYRSYPRAQEIIANAIGVHPSEIWPSRY